ncbi:DUF6479 family protein [Streptomyces sp. NPDC048338]|uniref:DUF6479 family protein n=1 Tax=Streptomyces sp. NPDC048338 TaxID=3365536 RepID=UPI0037164300
MIADHPAVGLASESAAAGSNALFLAVAIGIVVVGVLLASFWWGSRRVARRRRPVGDPTLAKPQPGGDSWTTPDDDPNLGDSRR